MKEITFRKNLTLNQIRSMVINLQEKFKRNCSIEIDIVSWRNPSKDYTFWFYIDDSSLSRHLYTWKDLCDYYNKVMREDNA